MVLLYRKGLGSIVPDGIMVISLEMVRVLASINVGASAMETPNFARNRSGSTLLRADDHNAIRYY